MAVALTILIILLSIVLIFFVLIQSSKGGGLSGVIGGVSQAAQFLGVRRATEEVEKITWYLALALALVTFALGVLLSLSRNEQQQQRLLRMEEITAPPITNPTAVPDINQLKKDAQQKKP